MPNKEIRDKSERTKISEGKGWRESAPEFEMNFKKTIPVLLINLFLAFGSPNPSTTLPKEAFEHGNIRLAQDFDFEVESPRTWELEHLDIIESKEYVKAHPELIRFFLPTMNFFQRCQNGESLLKAIEFYEHCIILSESVEGVWVNKSDLSGILDAVMSNVWIEEESMTRAIERLLVLGAETYPKDLKIFKQCHPYAVRAIQLLDEALKC